MEKAATAVVIEHVLYEGEGESRQPLFSDAELALVERRRLKALDDALSNGRSRPVLTITRRKCTYPLNAAGEKLALGSTCDETKVA